MRKKKKEKEKKAETMRDDEKEGMKKEKRRKKEGSSLSGQEPRSGTVVDATIKVTTQPPADTEEVSSLHSPELRSIT